MAGVNDATLREVPLWGAACARCAQPVLDTVRAVIHRRALYHAACWLQLMSAAARPVRGIANQAVSGTKDADGAR
jgi:hypothetical protein